MATYGSFFGYVFLITVCLFTATLVFVLGTILERKSR